MMLTIHGLPTSTTYQELKRLIKQECNITDFILDSLVMDDDGCKKVRIGVTDDGDGSHLMKCLNGYHYSGHVIRVVPVGKPNQQNQSNFDTRGGFQQRNDYPNNFGNRVVPQDTQPPRSNAWVPNMQWGQGMPAQVPQHTFPNQPIQSVVSNNFTHQQPRSYVPGAVPQHAQNFGYTTKSNTLEVPITNLKDNFQSPSQFHHQPVAQGHFQGQSNVQQASWNSQVPPVKPQLFDKPTTGVYNQIGYSDNRQVPKQGVGSGGGYKDYDKSDRRFANSTRDQSPGRRASRMSPDPPGRRMSPTDPPGRRMSPSAMANQSRRMSPSGSQGRRMSPSGHQSRRMSSPSHQARRMSPPHLGPPGRRISPGSHGRRMSPSRIPTGRGMSPSRQVISPHGRKLSPAVQGRRISPASYRRGSPPDPPVRRMSPGGGRGGGRISPPGSRGQRDSQHGIHARRMSPPSSRRISPGRRESSPGRRMSPADRRRVSPGRQSPGRRGSPSRRLSPMRHTSGRRSISPRRRSTDDPAVMRGYCEGNEIFNEDSVEPDNVTTEDNFAEDDFDDCNTGEKQENEFDCSGENLELDDDADHKDIAQLITDKDKRAAFFKPEVREVFKRLSGAGKKRYKILIADNVPWEKALEMCQKRWSQLPSEVNPKKRARMERANVVTAKQLSLFENKSYFLKNRKYAVVRIENVTHMTEKQSNILRQELISKIMQLPKGEGPRFEDYGYKSGALIVSCRDKQSQKWLHHKLPLIQPWPEAKLSATDITVAPKPMILTALLPQSEVSDPAQAFTLFKIQNRGLNTEEWVLKSTKSVTGGVLITISVDQRSAEILKESNYRACLGFKTIRFQRGFPLTTNKSNERKPRARRNVNRIQK